MYTNKPFSLLLNLPFIVADKVTHSNYSFNIFIEAPTLEEVNDDMVFSEDDRQQDFNNKKIIDLIKIDLTNSLKRLFFLFLQISQTILGK